MKRLLTGAATALVVAVSGTAAGVTPPNFHKATPSKVASAQKLRAASPRFVWAPDQGPAMPLSPLRSDVRPEAAARDALSGAAGRLGLPSNFASADSAMLREVHDLGHGPVIARFQQTWQGLPVFGHEMNVVMDRNLHPIAFSGQFAPIRQTASASRSAPLPGQFEFGEANAATAALHDLARESKVPGLRLTGELPAMKQVWYADRGELIPAYRLTLRVSQVDGGNQMSYGYLVSARNGEILVRKNLTADASFTYRVYASATSPFLPDDGPLGNARTPFPDPSNPANDPARTPVSANNITLQNGPISTMDPWLGTNATITSGNNVDAYYATGSQRAPISSSHVFAYSSTADADPTTTAARRAGIVNVFYLDNYEHDLWYERGFNEASGNAQLSNYGRGGAQGDPIQAETQDPSDRNNASMSTPPDGQSPVQRLHLFDGSITSSFTVTAPALGTLGSGLADFGPASFDLTGNLQYASPADGCSAVAALTGKIALIDRGSCNFVDKARNAQAAGATGLIVANNVAGDGPMGMGLPSGDTGSDITIPTMSISFEDGNTLKSNLGSGTVTVHMVRTTGADRDSALDNGIVSHEFFHYVSNRLIGDGFGLINPQGSGMGEGWSDFNALLLSVRPDDTGVPGNATWAGAYGLGLYVADSAYFGFRRAPYSTDMSINPLTFQHIQEGVPLPTTTPLLYGQDGVGNSEVHATGEIWANVLWEMYAALLNDGRYTFDQAKVRMMDYILGGLKATPNSPTLLDARDAILSVVRATDAQDYALAVAAFAKRGMGAGAVAPDRGDQDQRGVIESYVGLAAAYSIENLSFNLNYDDGTVGYCDHDNILDPGETAQLSFTVTSNGAQDLAAGATIQVSTDGDVTLQNGGLITLPALAIGQSVNETMTLVLNSASSTAQAITVTMAFPQAGATPDAVIEPATIAKVLHVNMDLSKTRTSDDMELPEASEHDWTVALTSESTGQPWVTKDVNSDFGTGTAWYAFDNGSPNSSLLTTPSFHVTSTFSMAFDHFFEFEVCTDTSSPCFDGSVIEVSVDNGAWQDAVAFGASFTTGNGYNGRSLALDPNNGRPAFVDTNSSLEHMVLNFGSHLAGHNARIRFRLESDEAVGAYGWVVDNVAFTGASSPVFSTAVAEDNVCATPAPTVDAGPDATANEGTPVQLTGTVTDRAGTAGLTYLWTRVSGPSVTLTNPTTLTPSFTAPQVNANAPLTLRLTVHGGPSDVTDDVVITIHNVPSAVTGGGGGGGSLGFEELALIGLLALARRRRA